jgi:ADP-ribose pyrophosphatase YjhB (NUDIX family)
MSDRHSFHSLGPFVYCPLCSRPLEITEQEELPRRYCETCGRVFYHNPVPAAGGVIMKDDAVLLVQRRFRPRIGDWTLPAGFLEYHESPPDCAVRELHEETGLHVTTGDVFGVYWGNDDPRHTAILVLYHMTVVGGTLRPGDDALEARYFAVADLPENIAFFAHKEALLDLYGDRIRARWAKPLLNRERKRNEAEEGTL